MFCSDSQDMEVSLLSQNLEHYGTKVDNINELNNYWTQFKELGIKTENDPKQWKSILTDPQTLLRHLKPLSCQKDNTLPCKRKEFRDRHVGNLLDMWKNNICTRHRKLKRPSNFEINLETKTSLIPERVISHFQRKIEQKPSHNLNSHLFKEKQTTFETTPESNNNRFSSFKTAKAELVAQQAKKNRQPPRKTLGAQSTVSSRFICPLRGERDKVPESYGSSGEDLRLPECENELLKNIEPKMIEQIKNEIMDSGSKVFWDDIAGLEYAKRIIQEVVVIPMLRPELFTGLRQPPKGILLFGPPGTGKTLIGKCIASQSKSTFFSISASSLTSKWIGEGEKLVSISFCLYNLNRG